MELDALMDGLSIDRQEIASRFCDNFSIFERFLRQFPQDPTYDTLRQARVASDAEGYRNAVHTLKGVAGNLGLAQLFSCSTNLLKALRDGQDFEQTAALDEQLVEEYRRVTQLIEQA